MQSMRIRLANYEDDRSIRKLIKENPIYGDIILSYQKDPNFFHSVSILGRHVDTVIAEEQKRIIGMGTKSIKSVMILFSLIILFVI